MQAEPTPGIAFESAAGRWVLGVAVAGSGIAFLDGTVVNVALPDIGRDFDATTSALQWVVNGYLLTLASLILLGGSLGDRYGRRRVFVARRRRASPSARCCARSRRASQVLIAARPLQGVGGALLTPGSLAIIEASFRPERPRRGDRRLVRPRRRRHGARPDPRRLAGRGDLLAGDLPDQPAAGDHRRPGRDPARPRDPRPDRDRSARPAAARPWPRSAWPAPPTP